MNPLRHSGFHGLAVPPSRTAIVARDGPSCRRRAANPALVELCRADHAEFGIDEDAAAFDCVDHHIELSLKCVERTVRATALPSIHYGFP
jgi:hypothetical protein